MTYKTTPELEAGLEQILQAPKDGGALRLIVRRPASDKREVLQTAQLDLEEGLVGDDWRNRSPRVDAQVTIMNVRVIALLTDESERWPLAGDQLFVDLDLSDENLPPGTRLSIGSAVLEVSALPHTGCAKFTERFGSDAIRFVNSPRGRQLHLRGINTRVVQPGVVQVGDVVRKVAQGENVTGR